MLHNVNLTVLPKSNKVPLTRTSVARLLGGRKRYKKALAKLRTGFGAPPRTARERRVRATYEQFKQTSRWPWQAE